MLARKATINLCLFACLSLGRVSFADYLITEFGALAADEKSDTAAIQAAIDAAAGAGGGTVVIPRGAFLSGGLALKSHVTLRLEEGAVLKGSDDCRDYGEGRWLESLIKAENVQDIGILGKGEIDGADCRNPKGEEGFRGPHGILLIGCKNFVIRDVTIRRTGNYAILCRNSEAAEIDSVTIRGGHDGLHAQACQQFKVRDCDFRTGDDCIAGCDNTDFLIANCQINSSCNGFRFGCVGLTVKDCRIWGPGEYQHQVSKRQNMLSAFVHFAPKDRNPQLPSDSWLIENVTIDNVGFVYGYDIEQGPWQKGQPAKRIRLHNVVATRVEQPIRVVGDADRQFQLDLADVSLALREDCANRPLLDLTRFGTLKLQNVILQNDGSVAVVKANHGQRVLLDDVACLPERNDPFRFEQIDEVVKVSTDDRIGELTTIPAGPFLMGNTGDEPFSADAELPQHSVNLPAYQIGKYEVTRGEYRKFIEAGGYQDPRYWSEEGWKWKEKVARREPAQWAAEQVWVGHGYGPHRFVQTDRHPVVGVTYYEAEAYCKWVDGRLPTEAEWEKAARWTGTHPNIFPWGDTWDPEKCNHIGDSHPAAGGLHRLQSAPVGSYPDGASPYGCLDMVGNAYEWVADWYKSYPGAEEPVDRTGEHRFPRGGCWDDGPNNNRCAYRGWSLPPGQSGPNPEADCDHIGFRVARSVAD